MKKVIYVASLLVAAVCMAEEKAAKPTATEHPQGAHGHMMSPEAMKALVAKFDKDGDGKLNDAEKAAAREAEMLKRFDKDGDGKLNDAEKTAAETFKKEMDARRAEMIKKFDKDGDGKLSDDEKKAAHEAFKKSHEGGKGDKAGKGKEEKKDK
jgi:Ca2+-binding EF-hand superfamily protein